MEVDLQKLKNFLLDAGRVTEKQFKDAVKKGKEAGKNIGSMLVAEGLVAEEELIKMQAYLLGIPFINLEKETIPPNVLKIIPEPIAKAHNIVAFKQKGNNLEVAMLDPEDLCTIEFIKKSAADLNILARLTTPNSIKNVLAQYEKNLETELGEIISNGDEQSSGQENDADTELKKSAQDLPITGVVDALLKHALLQRASDVHIEPLEKEVIVRYRVDGILRDVMNLPISAASGIVARIKVLSNLELDEHRLPQDGRFKFEKEGFKCSVRVSVLPVYNGEKVVMRLLGEDVKSYSLEAVGLAGRALTFVKDSLAKSSGMILITGPTGSGKTTTLYAMMEILNTPDVNISTVEDPIEYRMPRINQTQVNTKIGLTFASGLRVLVRQDPDIIMVGEIRDDETASLAINAALTGHLVLSTLHTTSAAGAMPRLIDMKAEPFLISSTLTLVIAQRLVRKFSDSNKKAYKLKKNDVEDLAKYCDPEKILDILRKEKLAGAKDSLEDVDFFRPSPSKDCPDGYRGRIGIFEVLPVTDRIKELIVKKADANEVSAQAIKDGMVTMIEDGFIKAAQGVTSIEEILRVITE